jgi:hypothetical protein
MVAKIFISYRHGETAGYAGHIRESLRKEFGDKAIYRDVDDMPLGSDFTEVLQAAVSKCKVLLALIGTHWLDVRDSDQERRLENPHDPVRVEIVTALQKKITVIPILLDGARIPAAGLLPGELQPLCGCRGMDISNESFDDDIIRLKKSLRANGIRPESPRRILLEKEFPLALGGVFLGPATTIVSAIIAAFLTGKSNLFDCTQINGPLIALSLIYFNVTTTVLYYKYDAFKSETAYFSLGQIAFSWSELSIRWVYGDNYWCAPSLLATVLVPYIVTAIIQSLRLLFRLTEIHPPASDR